MVVAVVVSVDATVAFGAVMGSVVAVVTVFVFGSNGRSTAPVSRWYPRYYVVKIKV